MAMKFALSATFLFFVLVCHSVSEANRVQFHSGFFKCQRSHCLKGLERRVDALDKKLQGISFSNLEEDIAKLENQVNGLLPVLQDLTERVENINKTTDELINCVKDLTQIVENVENSTQAGARSVSFFAADPSRVNFIKDVPIVFNEEILDTEDSFDDDTFTVIEPGVYFLQIKSINYFPSSFDIKIKRGEESHNFGGVLNASPVSSSSSGVLVDLQANDQVSLVCNHPSLVCPLNELAGNAASTLGGFLVHKGTA